MFGKLIDGLELMPEFIKNKFKNVLKNEHKIFITIKGVKSIKKLSNW